MLAALPSCDKDNNGDEPDPIADPSKYRELDVQAIQDAKIASKTPLFEGEYRYDVLNYVWSDDFQKFAGKLSKFSNNAAVAIGAKAQGNTAVSPISVFMALAMAAESADGDTRQEILDAMGITYDDLTANIKHLCYVCNQVLAHNEELNPYNVIKCINSLWVQNGVKVKDDGVKSLTDKFYTDLFRMNFDVTNVNDIITSYISNETRGFLAPNMEISPETLLVLMNVVYLRDVWNEFGDALDMTANKYDFAGYDNSNTSTNLLMGDYFSGRAVDAEKFRKFVTYTDGGLALTFFVPKDGYTLDDIYTSEVLNDPTPYVRTEKKDNVNYRYHTRCLFPEFSAGFDDYIEGVIQKMGVRKFFSSDCDFSHLTDNHVFCNKIRHITKLEVTRYGIEGAAVTAEMLCGDAGPDGEVWKDVYEDFIVDRSFAFVISMSGVPVFTGVVKTIN